MKKGLAKLQTIGNIFNLTMRLLTYLQNKQRKKQKNKLNCVILKTLHCERIASKITFCDLPISRIACPKQRGRYMFNTLAVNLTVFIKHQWYFDYKMSILLLNMQHSLRWTDFNLFNESNIHKLTRPNVVKSYSSQLIITIMIRGKNILICKKMSIAIPHFSPCQFYLNFRQVDAQSPS